MSGIFDRIKRNPVLVLVWLGALIALVEAQVADGSSWPAIVVAVLGLLARQLAVPASEVEPQIRKAEVRGFVGGLVEASLVDDTVASSPNSPPPDFD